MKSLQELQAIRDKYHHDVASRRENIEAVRVVVGMGTCGIAAGARSVVGAFAAEVAKQNLENIVVEQSGCMGACENEPVVEIHEPGKAKVTYVKMTADKAAEVVRKHLVSGGTVSEYMA